MRPRPNKIGYPTLEGSGEGGRATKEQERQAKGLESGGGSSQWLATAFLHRTLSVAVVKAQTFSLLGKHETLGEGLELLPGDASLHFSRSGGGET